MKRLVFLMIIGGLLPVGAQAQLPDSSQATHTPALQQWFFKRYDYYRPLVAEIRAATTRIEPLGFIRDYQYARPNRALDELRMAMDLSLGKEIPLWGFNLTNRTNHQPVGGVGLYLPISFHVLWDISDSVTAPIVDTDYRFAYGMLKGRYYLKTHSQQKASYLSFRLIPYGHESTHLGDEVTLYGFNQFSNFYRINISYEYWELGLSHTRQAKESNQEITFRVGAAGLWNRSKGFYSVDPREIRNATIYPSKRFMEYNLGLQLTHVYKKAFTLSSNASRKARWYDFLSVECRNRVLLDYEKMAPNQLEKRVWCVNAVYGWTFETAREANPMNVKLYFRYYYGLNPFGQLRNQYDWWIASLGLALDI
jgi:hypothetical protein